MLSYLCENDVDFKTQSMSKIPVYFMWGIWKNFDILVKTDQIYSFFP